MLRLALIALGLSLASCEKAPESVAPLYDTAPIATRDIEVTVEAAGVVEPETTVEVKSKASGEILAVHAETGDIVEAGTLLVEVDKRTPRNRLAEAEAALVAARARRNIAQTQMNRAETLHSSGTLTQSEFEQTQLEYANAQAQVVSSEVAVENARIAMDDTDVRAPITGTIIEKAVEPGMVISSPTQAVSGGSVLMKMADLTAVQVRTLVDETDIGKIAPGMAARVTVAAYPNQPFDGQVLKIEPQAIVESNVTRFAVLIRLDNLSGLLMPGMNADVEIQIARRDDVEAVPTAALRTDADIASTAAMLGLTERELTSRLDGREAAGEAGPGPQTINLGGRTIELPDGVDAERVNELLAKRRSGGQLTEQERAYLRPIMQRMSSNGPSSGGRGASPGGFGGFAGNGGGRRAPDAAARQSVTDYQFGGEYWVVALRSGKPAPVRVQTGLTDLAYTEIVSGLAPDDEVILLPSSSLYEQQARLQEFITRRFSSTPFQQQQPRGRPFR
jgi:HlyD family secretion protein